MKKTRCSGCFSCRMSVTAQTSFSFVQPQIAKHYIGQDDRESYIVVRLALQMCVQYAGSNTMKEYLVSLIRKNHPDLSIQ